MTSGHVVGAPGWIRAQLGRHGITVTADPRLTRDRPWSTQIVTETDEGRAYFKAGCPSMAFEPALHRTLAEIEPHEVDEPLGTDDARGWLLTRGRGATLAETRTSTTQDWVAVIKLCAQLQTRLVGHRDRLLATGLPDQTPGTVLARFDRLVTTFAGLPATHPTALTADERDALRESRPRIAAAVAAVEESGLPSTLQHGDLHPGNVIAVDGGLRIFDFGDAMWACPVEVLRVPVAVIADQGGVGWEQVVAAYVDGWEGRLDRALLDELWEPARILHAVNRAQTWWGAMAETTPEHLAEWGDAPRHHLLAVLDRPEQTPPGG